METQTFKKEVLAPALETIANQLITLADSMDDHSSSSAKYVRVAVGYILLAQQEVRR